MPRDPDGVAWAGPAVVALLLLAVGGTAIVLLLRSAPEESFASDHGVASSAEEWVRCVAETIEIHPSPFAAQRGFSIESTGPNRLVVRSALLRTEVQLVEGSLHYWRFQGWHMVPLDCPGIRPEDA